MLNVKQNLFYPYIGPFQVYHSDRSWPGNDGNERVLHIPESSSIKLFNVISRAFIGVGVLTPRAEMQSVYSTASADKATINLSN